jgi:hypothetical protein
MGGRADMAWKTRYVSSVPKREKAPAGGKSPGLPLLALRSCPPSSPLCSEQGPEIVSGMRSPRPGRIEVIRIAIPTRFCHKHSTFLTLVNFRFLQCPHRFSAGGTEIEKLNALWLLQSTYAREVLERFPPGFSLLTPVFVYSLL